MTIRSLLPSPSPRRERWLLSFHLKRMSVNLIAIHSHGVCVCAFSIWTIFGIEIVSNSRARHTPNGLYVDYYFAINLFFFLRCDRCAVRGVCTDCNLLKLKFKNRNDKLSARSARLSDWERWQRTDLHSPLAVCVCARVELWRALIQNSRMDGSHDVLWFSK